MSRPEFPGCALPSEMIGHIRREQEYYDQDPARYERHEREQEEREQEALEWEREEYNRIEQLREEELDNYSPPTDPIIKSAEVNCEDLPF